MGAWGPGLYSDDVTEDVRGIYVDKLQKWRAGFKRNDCRI